MPAKAVSPEKAVSLVRSGDVVVAPLFPGLGKSLLRALCARIAELNDITLLCGDLRSAHDYLDVIPEGAARGRLKLITLAGGFPRRTDMATDWAAMPLWQLAQMLRTGVWRADVCLLPLTPPGADGMHRISPTLAWLADAAAGARTLLAEVSPNLPHMTGDNAIDPARVGAWIESTGPADAMDPGAVSEVQKAIAQNVAGLIPDGACLQVGIGSVVEALLQELRGHKDLGFHSGSLPDGAAALIKAGVITNRHNPLSRGESTTNSVRGSLSLYEFAHRNESLRLRAFSYVHDPKVIAAIPNFTAVNSALMADINGQVSAEISEGRMRSPGGGQLDFMRAAFGSEGGRRIIALPSTDARTGKSKLVAAIPAGYLVTTHRMDVDFIVTEFGVAALQGATMQERQRRIAAIAHPQYRDELLAGIAR